MRFHQFLAIFAFAIVVSGCPEDGGGGDDDDNDSADDDDSTEAIEQAEACAHFVACIAEVDPMALGEALDQYGPDGSCWVDAETAALCEGACLSGWDMAVETYHPPAGDCYAEGATWFDFDDEGSLDWYPIETSCSHPMWMLAFIYGTPRPEVEMSLQLMFFTGSFVDLVCPVSGLDFDCGSFTLPDVEHEFTFQGYFAENYEEAAGTVAVEPGGEVCDVMGYYREPGI